MADTKITALTALTAADPANDVIPIVDVSDTSMAASGTTKKISVNNILGASGTATLASATITGALTVGNGTSATQTFSGVTNILDIGYGSLRGGSAYGDVRLWTDRFRIYNNAGTQIIKNISGTNGDETWYDGAGGTRMTLNSTGLGIGVTPANNKFQVAGNIGLPNSCTASGETSGVFSIDVANLLTLTGGNWRQTSILIVYSGIDSGASNPTVLQTVVTLTGLATWDTISKNDIVGTASVAVSNDTTTGARITVTVPTGNSGSVYAMLLGGAGGTTRPSMTINA